MQALQDGQDEGGSLAGAGLGQAEQVTPSHNRGDGLRLDGGGGGITRRMDTRFDLRVKIKRVEIHKMFLIHTKFEPGQHPGPSVQ